ncbi:hypothetical protein LCGC14_1046720 [marine sediment metagenome]|uniref:Uncharacterized protein n=1 Tax=marine sediment metagenome TaxID=412755 RepID=A0A0F9QW93_9ZZZZ
MFYLVYLYPKTEKKKNKKDLKIFIEEIRNILSQEVYHFLRSVRKPN